MKGAIVTKDPEEQCGFSITSEGREYRFQGEYSKNRGGGGGRPRVICHCGPNSAAPSADERDAWVLELEEAVLRQMVCRRAYHVSASLPPLA